MLTSKTDAELKQLAIDVFNNKVFTDWHLGENPDAMLAGMIFMPLALGALKDWPEEEIDNIGTIYEYNSKAWSAFNGSYPIFSSMQLLSHDDTHKMWAFFEQYKTHEAGFLEGTING